MKTKVTQKTLTKEKVEFLFSHFGEWNGKTSLSAKELESYNEIACGAFQDQKELVKIEIPSSIKKVGNGAFINCLRLREVIIPEGLKFFGIAVFGGCWSLKKVNIPADFKTIPDATFADCENLNYVALGNNIRKIGVRAFANCITLKEIIIPESCEVIKENAFYNCPNLEKGFFSENFYYQAHNFGLFEEQFNQLNVNLKAKTSNSYLFEQKLITREEYETIYKKIENVKFKPRGVTQTIPQLLANDENLDQIMGIKKQVVVAPKKEEPKATALVVKKAPAKKPTPKKEAPKKVETKPVVVKKPKASDIPVNQKHQVVTISEYQRYNYNKRRKEWHQKAGYNKKQVDCFICSEKDNWASIKLENGKHICYTCWISKPDTLKKKYKKAFVNK